jgi:hypothetical protein
MAFDGLSNLVDDLVRLLDEVLVRLLEVDDLPPRTRAAIPGARDAIFRRLEEIQQAIHSGEYDDALVAHGLADDDPEWQFKSAGYFESREAFESERQTDFPTEPPTSSWPKRFLKRVKHPLKWGNLILRSLSVIPGAGALGEIKDGAEAAADKVSES